MTHESIGFQRSKGIHRHTGTENLHDRRFLEDGLGTKCSYRHYGYKSRRKRKGMKCPFEIILLLFNIYFYFFNLAQPKCDQYWPEDAENPLSFDSLSISQLNETDFETYTLRSFQIKRVSDQTIIYCGTIIIANTFSQNGKSRTVKQAYLKGWPDFGVPDNPEILIRFIEVVRILAKETPKTQTSNSNQPIVVHCR